MLRKMSFQAAKEKYLQMSFAEKRQHYKNKDYMDVSKIPQFNNGPKIAQQYPKTCDRVYLWRGDITRLEIDAIVNAANKQLARGGGVCGSIHGSAGKDLADECDSIGGCGTSDAVITGGYRLPAKYVIHAVGPIGEKPEQLKNTYKSILKICEDQNLHSVAIPCISTGIYGYPADKAASIAVHTVLENLPPSVEKCILCTFLEQDNDLYTNLLSE